MLIDDLVVNRRYILFDVSNLYAFRIQFRGVNVIKRITYSLYRLKYRIDGDEPHTHTLNINSPTISHYNQCDFGKLGIRLGFTMYLCEDNKSSCNKLLKFHFGKLFKGCENVELNNQNKRRYQILLNKLKEI